MRKILNWIKADSGASNGTVSAMAVAIILNILDRTVGIKVSAFESLDILDKLFIGLIVMFMLSASFSFGLMLWDKQNKVYEKQFAISVLGLITCGFFYAKFPWGF